MLLSYIETDLWSTIHVVFVSFLLYLMQINIDENYSMINENDNDTPKFIELEEGSGDFDSDDEETFVNNISHVKYAEELSRETGVKITIESAMTLPRIQRMLEEVSRDDKICMDLLNPLRFCTGDPQEQIRVFGTDWIDHFHMKDSISSLFVKGQRGCVPLGTGDADLKGSCQIIRELGFEGWFITENYYMFSPMNDGEQDFIELAKSDLKRMKDLI